MSLRKLQLADGPVSGLIERRSMLPANDGAGERSNLIYGGVALGLLAGAAISAYWWKQRARASNLLNATPFERAEELITSCEHRIEDIERAIEELKAARP